MNPFLDPRDELNDALIDFYSAAVSLIMYDYSEDFSFAAKFTFQNNVYRFVEAVRRFFLKHHYICNDTVTDLCRGTGDPKCYIVDIYAEKEPEET